MMIINCKCSLDCACGCKLRNSISILLDVMSQLDNKRQALSDVLDCEVVGFDPISDNVVKVIAELLEFGEDLSKIDLIYDIVFGFVFHRVDKYEAIERLLEL